MFEHEGEICNCDIGGNMTPDWIRVSGKKLASIGTEVNEQGDSSAGSARLLKVSVTVQWDPDGEHGFEDITDAMEFFGVGRGFLQRAVYTCKKRNYRMFGKFLVSYSKSDRKDDIPE